MSLLALVTASSADGDVAVAAPGERLVLTSLRFRYSGPPFSAAAL